MRSIYMTVRHGLGPVHLCTRPFCVALMLNFSQHLQLPPTVAATAGAADGGSPDPKSARHAETQGPV